MDAVLNVKDMNIKYETAKGLFQAVTGVSFEVGRNSVFGIAGESGSGKSTLCMGLLKLLPTTAKTEVQSVCFEEREIRDLEGEALRKLRWELISYIPQSAMSTLNPVKKIRDHFYETMIDHEGKKSREELNARTVTALRRVSLEENVADKFPHELSGGMKQRICIAMSTLLQPRLIIADEPTSALDVISQRSVLEILSEVRKTMGASMIMIGHDMALQAQVADRLGIMYAGYFIEIGTVEDIFFNPVHPYTKRLIKSIPSIKKKEDISMLVRDELTEKQREIFKTPRPLEEVSPGHFAVEFD